MTVTEKKGAKTRSAGRFGVRYGRKSRKLLADIEEKMHAEYKCAKCGNPEVRRIGAGIWRCRKCSHTFTGGAYIPNTSAGLTAERSLVRSTEAAKE